MCGRGHIIALAFLCLSVPAHALQLELPANARQTAARDSVLDQVAVATAPFADGTLTTRTAEGAVTRRAYRIPSSGLTPLQILAPLRAQLESAGYEVLLDCDQDKCGGFDFRFAIDVLPAPNMYVNIRAYHFLSALHAETGAVTTVLASAAAGAAYLQIVQIGSKDVAPAPDAPSDTARPADAAAPAGDLATRLIENGHAILNGIEFAIGTTTVRDTANGELAALAAIMRDRPGLRIAVVGHTDTVGALDTNIAVSRARAQSVRSVLIDTYGLPGNRIEAEGMGYLSPIASNLTAEGRKANRRVEVIVVREDG